MLPTVRQPYVLIAIAIGLVGLALDFVVILGTMAPPQSRSLANVLVYYWSFLTNLSNLALIVIYLATLTNWKALNWFRHPVSIAGMGGIMLLVMGFYHFMLAPTLPPLPLAIEISNVLLHYVTPVLFLVWWALFASHGSLRVRDVPAMLVPGLGYVGWVMLRGPIAGEYPYTILDPGFVAPGGTPAGYAGVALAVGVLVVMVAILDLLLVGIDGLISRRRKPA